MELNAATINLNGAIIRSVEALLPTLYERPWRPKVKGSSVAADRRTLHFPDITATIGGVTMLFPERYLDMNVAANWDSVTPTDYTVAANRAGLDVYLYATLTGRLLLSANATVPSGYTADQVRLLMGFHCLCLSVGTISGHPLTGFLTGDILPASVWDLAHRPVCSPAGMVYSDLADIWVDVYLQSGTGSATRSAFGATITDSRNWNDFVDDLAAVRKRLLSDTEFQIAAAGGNEQTNILGSADPVTAGAHVDTASRRMISNIGCEDMVGAMLQWLLDQSYRNDDASYSGVWGWQTLGSSKGSLYRQGVTGDVKLLAGGAWAYGANCGSRSRNAYNYRWAAYSHIGSRGCARRQG